MSEYKTSENLTEKYRPKTLADVVGQKSAVAQIKGMVKQKKVPSTILISGKTGLGKTTLALVIAYLINELDYGTATQDIQEYNIGEDGGIDNIRNILRTSNFKPSANFRVIILDEVQRLSGASAAALLKPLEKPAPNTIWILCTDQPEKILGTIKGRSLHLALQGLEPEDLVPRLKHICEKEKYTFLNDKTLLSIARNANAEPRSTINLLQATVNAYHGGNKDVKIALAQALELTGAGVDILAAKLLSCVYRSAPKGVYNTLKLLKANEWIGLSNYMLYHAQFVFEQKIGVTTWMNETRKKLIESIDLEKLSLKKLTKVHTALVETKMGLMTFQVPEFDFILTKLLTQMEDK